jgi:NDP-hexose-3-ketoreductase
MADSPLRWGVIGASSRIYQGKLRPPMVALDRHEIVAEASRDASGSEAPYAELLGRADVDAVYIPLPNSGHSPWIERALEAGKHVLCEKPLTMTVADTDRAFDVAASSGRVLVEAYMWPHHPRNQLVLDLVREHLGGLRWSRGRFSFPLGRPDNHRVDARGGGALFDVGIYCLGPALLLAPREPVQVAAVAVRNEHGADVSLSGWLDLGDGFSASADVSFESVHIRSLDLTGTGGSIRIPTFMAPGPDEASTVTVEHADDRITTHQAAGADAYGEMIDQFADVVQRGGTPRWGATESRLLARWIEALHHASGG